jgi:hypothetical protein
VFEIGRALKDHQGMHDLGFVLFGGEEQSLRGSRQYVAALDAATRARVRAVVNMDRIASLNTAIPSVLLEGDVVSQAVIDGLAEAAATYTGLIVQTSLIPHDSDHVSFRLCPGTRNAPDEHGLRRHVGWTNVSARSSAPESVACALHFSLPRLAVEAFVTCCLYRTAAHLCPPSFDPRRMDPASCSGSSRIRMGQASGAASATS